MKTYLLLIVLIAWFPASEARESSLGEPVTVFTVKSGDYATLRSAILAAEDLPGVAQINLVDGPGGTTVTRFPGVSAGSSGALPDLSEGHIWIRGNCSSPCRFSLDAGAPDNTRLVLLTDSAVLEVENMALRRFGTDQNGGVILAKGSSGVFLREVEVSDNFAGGYGGAISVEGNATMSVINSYFARNIAFLGSDLNIGSKPLTGPAATIEGTSFVNGMGEVALENSDGNANVRYSTINHQFDGIASNAQVFLWGNVLDDIDISESTSSSESAPGNNTKALCNENGKGTFNSQGYNIAADSSCSLDQATDLSRTDPKLELDESGLLVPQAGSPAIDSGAIEATVFEDETLASLPCGYRDATGTARPQDANGDGVFECDRGAVEVAGTGQVVDGHSSVFYNPDRNGEGNYVEILDDSQAVVYTFTYNPEGDGPAWFLGVGEVNGNSIILNDLFRPTGTPFGDEFDAGEVEFTPAGSMSMVFPDCQASAPGGNIAYTGDAGLGYEGLVSRATRLAHITGCGNETPDPNAGLSGSFYDPARNGEGLIVEWLTNGDVLVVFFTFDMQGNQLWLFGQAAANGKSVTMSAVYPTGFTPWGRNYDPDEVSLDAWGTFTLNWTGCNTLSFQYTSDVAGFGSAMRNYTRLSKLAGTNCPSFP